MRVLLIEDDPRYSTSVIEYVEGRFSGTTVHLIDSEVSFQDQFSDIMRQPPDLIILDIMIRWIAPGRSPFYTSPYAENAEFTRAGTRCLARLQNSAETAQIPVLIHSVLERVDIAETLPTLPAHYSVLHKHSSLDALGRHIDAMYPGLAVGDGRTFSRRLWDAFGATLRISGMSLDLKKLFTKQGRRGDPGA